MSLIVNNSEPERVDFSAQVERLRKLNTEMRVGEKPVVDDETAVRIFEAENRRKALGVPRRIADVLQKTHETAAMASVGLWLLDRNPSDWCLVLSGQKGCGKSVAAGFALTALAGARGKLPTVWDAERSAERRLRAWWTSAELAAIGSFNGELEALCEFTGPLVLDDLGVEYADAKGFFSQLLDRLIDARYREYSPTVITTNLNAADFKQRYGERLIDRLREGGKFVALGNAQSLRGENA